MLAARLVALRTGAGLSGNALARRMGVVQSRVWKIEHAELTPGEADIRAWVTATGHGDETAAELLALMREAHVEFQTFKAFGEAGGAAAYQAQVQAAENQSTRIGEFQIALIPGIVHTDAYARELVNMPCGPRSWGTDDAGIEAMIDGRLLRQEILHDRSKRIQVVVWEGALRSLAVAPETLAGQLDRLLSVMWLPAVELGVISYGTRWPAYPLTGFRIYDEDLIMLETLAGEDRLTAAEKPEEVGRFVRDFDVLQQAATTGADAEAIIQQALDDLRTGTA
jgi:transcriptional regulator with XRE-family HTH domain